MKGVFFDNGRTCVALLGTAVFALTSCSRVDGETDAALAALRDGSAKAAIQRYFDQHRECAPMLRFDKRTRSYRASAAQEAAAAALADAGLIEPAPGAGQLGERLYRPASSAGQWFDRQDQAEPTEQQLCFARRSIRDVSLYLNGTQPELRYTFALVDPAPWMRRPAIRAAFPIAALAADDDEAIYAASDPIRLRDGKPQLGERPFPLWEGTPLSSLGADFTGDAIADRVEFNGRSNGGTS